MTSPALADDVEITADVVYGHKDGMALTFDILTPSDPNGAAVMWLQSGGWYSNWMEPEILVLASAGMLNEGYTVFIVRHGSAPRYQVPDAVADVQRCVRFIRMNAAEYGIDPERIGVLGGSAGGHLTLMLAVTGDDGDPGNVDPILRESSRVACGVSLYPPTDLRGWTTDPPEVIAAIPTLEPPLDFDAELEDDVSPILHVTEDDAPVIIIHGDLDELVPISHANNIMPVLEEAGVECELVVIEGAAHGFDQQQNEEIVGPAMMRWFNAHLASDSEETLENE
jgi:acetyl esterase/lipase